MIKALHNNMSVSWLCFISVILLMSKHTKHVLKNICHRFVCNSNSLEQEDIQQKSSNRLTIEEDALPSKLETKEYYAEEHQECGRWFQGNV